MTTPDISSLLLSLHVLFLCCLLCCLIGLTMTGNSAEVPVGQRQIIIISGSINGTCCNSSRMLTGRSSCNAPPQPLPCLRCPFIFPFVLATAIPEAQAMHVLCADAHSVVVLFPLLRLAFFAAVLHMCVQLGSALSSISCCKTRRQPSRSGCSTNTHVGH